MNGGVKSTPVPNPYYVQDIELDRTFHSQIFTFDPASGVDDQVEYCKLMQRLYDPNELIEQVDKSRNFTKDGTIIIHVEWIEYEKVEPESDKY